MLCRCAVWRMRQFLIGDCSIQPLFRLLQPLISAHPCPQSVSMFLIPHMAGCLFLISCGLESSGATYPYTQHVISTLQSTLQSLLMWLCLFSLLSSMPHCPNGPTHSSSISRSVAKIDLWTCDITYLHSQMAPYAVQYFPLSFNTVGKCVSIITRDWYSSSLSSV